MAGLTMTTSKCTAVSARPSRPSFELGGCKGQFSYYFSGYYEHTSLGLQAPTDSPDPNHDYADQGQGFGYLSYLVNSDTRLSLVTGAAVNSFEIPPEPGLPQQFMLEGVPNYPSSEVKENGLEAELLRHPVAAGRCR